jgi:hypothetical protein
MPVEKSDHLIVALKPGNAGGAKGMTECKESDIDNWNSRSQHICRKADVTVVELWAYPLRRHGYGI